MCIRRGGLVEAGVLTSESQTECLAALQMIPAKVNELIAVLLRLPHGKSVF